MANWPFHRRYFHDHQMILPGGLGPLRRLG
jgi:hypothetical protein